VSTIKIKVCGLRDLQNAGEVANAGPDFMGFLFYPGSKRYVGSEADIALFQQVPARIKKVGVFVNEKPEKILELAYQYDLDLLQLHGSESVQECRVVRSAGYQVIKAFGVNSGFDFTTLSPFIQVCDYFLFDTKSEHYGGTGQKFNWEKIRQYSYNVPFFLSGGIGPNDTGVIRKLKHPAFFAIDINSRFEVETGLKNVNQIKAFIKEIKTISI
jgi:phosphoribosylanthranilate isomerase